MESAAVVLSTPGPGTTRQVPTRPRRLRVAECHIGRRLLVSRMDDADFILAAIKRVKNVVELNPGQTEDGVDAFGGQCVDKIFGAR